MTLDEAVEFAKRTSQKVVESGGEHIPTVLILTPNGFGVAPLGGVPKDILQPALHSLLRIFNAYAYIFIDEAWVADLPIDCPTVRKLLRGEVLVSELPPDDKTEVLIIVATENKKPPCFWVAKIRYTPEDKRYLDEWEKKGAGEVEGRLVLREW